MFVYCTYLYVIFICNFVFFFFRFYLIHTPSSEISKTGSHSKNQSITEFESSVRMSSIVWCDSHDCWCDSSYGDNCPALFNHSFSCYHTGYHGKYWWIQGQVLYTYFRNLNILCLYTSTVLVYMLFSFCYVFRFHLIDIPSLEISKTGSHSKDQSITKSESSIHSF